MIASPAFAAQWNDGDLSIRLDTTLDLTTTIRTSPLDTGLIGAANGGRLPTLNLDDGNLNYRKGGVVSALARVFSEFEVSRNGWGIFASGSGYFDLRNGLNGATERTNLSEGAISRIGRGGQLSSAYGFGAFDVLSAPVDFKIGAVPLSWGEAILIPNGIGAISPLDVARLHSPAATLRDALLPEPMVTARVRLSGGVSLEGFVEYGTQTFQLDPAGSYFSTADFLGAGGSRLFLSALPPTTDAAPYLPGSYVNRGRDHGPSDGGQFGLSTHISPAGLNGTEFGLYFMQINSRLPVLGFNTGTVPLAAFFGPPAGVQLAYANSSRYFLDYPDHIRIVGASLSMPLPGNLTLRGEVAWRFGQPLQIDASELSFAALSPLAPVFGASQVGGYGFGQTITGYQRQDVATAIASVSGSFTSILGADALETTLEAGVVAVPNMPGWDQLRFAGAGAYTSGNPLFTALGAQPYTSTSGFATRVSAGYRVLAQLDYYDVYKGVSVFPRLAIAHDVAGVTPAPLSNFVADRKALSIGVSFMYRQAWTVAADYTHFFGAGDANLLRDRDYISLLTRVTF